MSNNNSSSAAVNADIPVDDLHKLQLRSPKFGSFVKIILLIKNWLTGKADVDNDKTRIKDDLSVMTLFMSLQQANMSILNSYSQQQQQRQNEKRNKKELLFTKIKKWLYFTIDDTEKFYYFQSFMITLTCLFNLITIPMTIFKEFERYFYYYWLSTSWIIDIINVLDIFLLTRKEYLDNGIKVKDLKLIAKNYFNTRKCLCDLIAIIPTDVLLLKFPNIGFIRLNKLFKIHRINDFLQQTEIKTNFPHLFRLLRLVIICVIIFHWNGCIYFVISIIYDYHSANFDDFIFSYDKIFNPVYPKCDARWKHLNCSIYESDFDYRQRNFTLDKYAEFYKNKTETIEFSNFTKKYTLSFFWSALTLTTLGENASPNDSFQTLFEIIDTLIGLTIIAVIVGDVGDMITSLNMTRSRFEENLDGCKRYMNFRNVNKLLGNKIISWFEYGWKDGSVKIDEEKVVGILPPRLKAQLAVHIHMDTLKKVNLFKDCEPTLLCELVLRLKLCIFSPNDYVCQKGDIGKELYIIKKGKLQVVSEDGKKVFATLEEGKVFGELSILNIRGNKNGNKRTASIKSVGYSDLYILTKHDLWEVLREYPEAKKNLIEIGKSILKKDGLLAEDDKPEDDILDEEAAIDQKLLFISKQIKNQHNNIDQFQKSFYHSSKTIKQKVTSLEQKYIKHVKTLKRNLRN